MLTVMIIYAIRKAEFDKRRTIITSRAYYFSHNINYCFDYQSSLFGMDYQTSLNNYQANDNLLLDLVLEGSTSYS